ncbi:MAG: TauD/TfdA family dioxygenase, partial [Blastocatellia bacterium]
MQIDFAPKTENTEPGRWDRAGFVGDDGWRVSIPATVLDEFLISSAALSTSGTNWQNYRPGLIRLSKLELLAKRVQTELQGGTGVVLLQGLNTELLGEEQARLFLVLLSTQFAGIIGNYGRLYDVIDRGLSYKENSVPVSQTNAATTFHTDSSALNTMPDVVGMLCLRQAKSGGESLLANAVDVHEKIRRARPDLLARLYEDYVRDIVTPGTEKTCESLCANRIPIFSYKRFSEGLSFRYMRYWIETG